MDNDAFEQIKKFKIHGKERNVEEYTPLKIKLYVLYSM